MTIELKFDNIKNFYDKGLWKLYLVKIAVKKGIITKDQFEEITGQKF